MNPARSTRNAGIGWLHFYAVQQDDVHLSYLPLAHMLERVVTTFVFSAGAQIGFYTGDVQNLFDDISTPSLPTLLPAPLVGYHWNARMPHQRPGGTRAVGWQVPCARRTFSRSRDFGTACTTASRPGSPSRASSAG